MMYETIYIYRHNCMIEIDNQKYIGYTIKQAIKRFRTNNGLKYKHITFNIVSLW